MKAFLALLSLALITAVYAGHASSYASRTDDNHGHHSAPSHEHDDHHDDHHGDYSHHPSYKYEYGVKDPKTGDHKSAWEHRDGDKVTGEYTLDEADGTKRVVKYSSDKKNGFEAHVERIGHASHAHEHHGHHDHY